MAKNNTSFEKGKPKTGGRKPGSKNRTTAEIREFIQKVVDDNMETLQDDLDLMNPFMRRKTINDLIKYFLPAMTKNDNDNKHSGAIKIVVEYEEHKPPADDESSYD